MSAKAGNEKYIGILHRIKIPKEIEGYGDRLKEAMEDAFLKHRTCIVADAMHNRASVMRSDELAELLGVDEKPISEIAGRAVFADHYITGTNLAVYTVYVWEQFVSLLSKPLEERNEDSD